MKTENIDIKYVNIEDLKPAEYNPRQASELEYNDLKKSLLHYGIVDPIIVNAAPNRLNVVIGGHFRLRVARDIGYKNMPCVYVNVPDEAKERELNLRLNKNLGEWNLELLANFDEELLKEVGFTSEELDNIFELDNTEPETFDLQKELERLKISTIEATRGDIWALGDHRLMCGDSTSQEDLCKLLNNQKASMLFRYLETNEAPTFDKWIPEVAKFLKENANIMIFENWKNIIPLWQEMEKHWRIRNLIIWHLSNRHHGFAAKYRFFSKYDIALFATEGNPELNLEDEDEILQNEYNTAIYATSGKPHWEPYKKGGKFCPTDVITFRASDLKHSGQGIVFGTKPIEILVPYLKVLTKRGDNVIEPFGGSGSTLIACEKMKRRCFTMELVPTYCEVIKKRWETLTGQKAEKISDNAGK